MKKLGTEFKNTGVKEFIIQTKHREDLRWDIRRGMAYDYVLTYSMVQNPS